MSTLNHQSDDTPTRHFEFAAGTVFLWVQDDGTVWSSGAYCAQRGDLDEVPRRHFQPIAGLKDILSVRLTCGGLGESGAGLDRDGKVWLWGKFWNDSPAPQPYPKLPKVVSIALGETHLVTAGADGIVRAVGFATPVMKRANLDNNSYGELGNGSTTSTCNQEMVVMPGVEDVVAVAASGGVTIMLKQDGTVWGVGNKTLLGMPSPEPECEPSRLAIVAPKQIDGPKDIRAIEISEFLGAALDQEGHVWAWGDNREGQLAWPPSPEPLAPRKLEGLADVIDISIDKCHLFAVRKDGRLLAYGCPNSFAAADFRWKTDRPPYIFPNPSEVTRVYPGAFTCFAQTADGRFWGWGLNQRTNGGFHPLNPARTNPVLLDRSLRPPPTSELVKGGGSHLHLSYTLRDGCDWQRFAFLVDGIEVGEFEVDSQTSRVELSFEVGPGAHAYSLQGWSGTADGEQEVRTESAFVCLPPRGRFGFNGPSLIQASQQLKNLRPQFSAELLELEKAGPEAWTDSLSDMLREHGVYRLVREEQLGDVEATLAPDHLGNYGLY